MFFGLFIGFYLFKLDHTPNNMQSASLGVLVAFQGLPAIALDIAINFLQKFDLYVARERLGIYSWYALVTSLLIVALPILVIGYTLLFFCNYWTMGFGTTAENGALIWLIWVAIAFFTASCGLLLGAVSPSPFAVPYILALVWNRKSGYIAADREEPVLNELLEQSSTSCRGLWWFTMLCHRRSITFSA